MDRIQLRFCLAITCDKLKNKECTVEECEHPDKAVALDEKIEQLRAARR